MTTETIETALTIQKEQELAELLEGVDLSVAGEENLRQGDIGMPPRLRLSQPNRPIEIGDKTAPAGSIVNTLTGEWFEHGIDIVPLVFLPRTRVMWPDDFSTENDPLCASDDGDAPRASTADRPLGSPAQGPCSECLYARFNEDDGGPPPCKLQRNFLVMLVEQEEPAILTLQSTSIKAARQLTALAKAQGLRKSIKYVTQLEKGERGQWYVAAFVKGRKLTSPELLALVEARDELQNLVITADEVYENGRATGDDGAHDSHPEEDSIPF